MTDSQFLQIAGTQGRKSPYPGAAGVCRPKELQTISTGHGEQDRGETLARVAHKIDQSQWFPPSTSAPWQEETT